MNLQKSQLRLNAPISTRDVLGFIGRKAAGAVAPSGRTTARPSDHRLIIDDLTQLRAATASEYNAIRSPMRRLAAGRRSVGKPGAQGDVLVVDSNHSSMAENDDDMVDMSSEDFFARLRATCQEHGERTALMMEQEGIHLTLTYGELWRRASRVAGALIERGIGPGERVAILSESRPEWGICLLAGLLAEAVVVPLDHMLEEGELLAIVDDSTPSVLFVSKGLYQTGKHLVERADSLTHLFLLNGRNMAEQVETIRDIETATPVSVRRPKSTETALIVYTSGTMGRPKGVVTRFGALSFQVSALYRRFNLTADDRFLSILPLNHLLELTAVLLCALHIGSSVVYAHSRYPTDIVRILRNDRITVIVGVPIFFRALRKSIVDGIANQSALVRYMFRGALGMARYLPAVSLRRLLFFPLYHNFGSSLRFCASGGAYLEPPLIRFFELIGIPLLQGYGLTETGPVISVNGPKTNRVGSVGRPLRGIELRIDRSTGGNDGEILTRGPHVMPGYYQQPDLTRSVLDESGWFRTGDIGEIDADGYLYVTGRLKNVIVLDSGKNVQPEEIEEVILRCPLVQECCVIGRPGTHSSFERLEEVCAVVVPTAEVTAAHHGDQAAIQDVVETAVMEQVRALAAYKRPVAVEVTTDELPKSPMQKIKRNEIRERFGVDQRYLGVE